ncbi:DNA gyrase inhibitor YacG [Catenovulum sp. SM1970]|uniref:DNA gyrase inhibitor YacG n=1 Tax=Marinifaba aquimaris TaxID=2741323 RepID=UPI001574A50B|nr:DNA gyrase inhibitor YacG [Marinifaba aquimaris]NTS76576.1 DNA gyrase inhibitor YacG [Marinifaba aquimaris]
MNVNCPTCKKEVVWSTDNEFRPFCSKRCKLIDLGEWASESNVIKGENLKPNLTGHIDEFDIEEMLGEQLNEQFFKE